MLEDEAEAAGADRGKLGVRQRGDFLAADLTLPPAGRSSVPATCSRVRLARAGRAEYRRPFGRDESPGISAASAVTGGEPG